MAATPEEAAYRLEIQSEMCLEAVAVVTDFPWLLYVSAGAFAEAAAHWAFELHPELRVDDEY
jgi:hypothetical protein